MAVAVAVAVGAGSGGSWELASTGADCSGDAGVGVTRTAGRSVGGLLLPDEAGVGEAAGGIDRRTSGDGPLTGVPDGEELGVGEG